MPLTHSRRENEGVAGLFYLIYCISLSSSNATPLPWGFEIILRFAIDFPVPEANSACCGEPR